MTTEEKLQNFYNHSLDSANREAERVIGDHQKALDKIFEEHKATARRQAEEEIAAETEKAKRDVNKTLSADQLHIRLTAYKKDPSYEEYLERKIREAVTFAGNDKLTLYLDPSDEAHKASLEQKLSVTLTISAMPFLGGVRAVIPEKNILIDNSFETLLNEERENFIFHGGVEHE